MKSYENKSDAQEVDAGMSSGEMRVGGEDVTISNPPVVPTLAETEQQEATQEREISVDVREDEIGEVQSPPATGREQLWTAIAFLPVLVLGAILRFWQLGERPLHHDESLHGYFSLQLLHNNIENWVLCLNPATNGACYRYDPLLHGPFQFHAIATVYAISQLLGAPDFGVNTTTVRIAAALAGIAIVGLPFFLRDYIGKVGAWLACFLLAVSPSMVYYSRFAREDIYMACFTVLLVVSVARYVRTRKAVWFISAAIAFTLAYATKEATFLVIAVFGSFLGALIVWELGTRWSWHQETSGFIGRFVPKTGGVLLVFVYFALVAVVAKVLLGQLSQISTQMSKSTAYLNAATAYVTNLKAVTEGVIPWLGILLAVVVIVILLREQFGRNAVETRVRRGLAHFINPREQPVLDTIFTMPWTHWFFGLVIGWFIFLILFTALFTNIPGGIGDGIWQGLFYWIQQQQVARGGQPWYYYLLLIPLYEQIGLVFGLVGVARCLWRPSRFRLFMVFWFLGNLFIYSWAGEKMPWLTIHIAIPMLILAAIGLEPAISYVIRVVRERPEQPTTAVQVSPVSIAASVVPRPTKRPAWLSLTGAILTVVVALMLLTITLQNMLQLNYVHYADAPHEMMIYVQTSTDIDTVMDRVNALDQKLYGGRHELPIGLTDDALWPYAWYLRDYTDVCFNFPTGCTTTAKSIPIIITGADSIPSFQLQYGQTYAFHQYHLRTQWDQGYMPVPCVSKPNVPCAVQQYTGVGPGLWLSYGDNPPPNAKTNIALAAGRIWNWWWHRQAFGDITGSYDMGLFIKNDVVNTTGISPNP